MKLYSLIIAAVLVFAGASCTRTVHAAVDNDNGGVTKKTEKKVPAAGARLNYYEYEWSGMRWPPIHYVLTHEDGRNVLYICSFNAEACDRVEVPAEVYDRVGALVLEYGLLNMGTYSVVSDARILDGYAWSNSIRFDDGTRNYSHGSNAGPDEEGIKAVNSYLDEVAKQAGAKGDFSKYNDLFRDF